MSRIYDNKPLLNLPLINVELGQWNQEAMTGGDGILIEGAVKRRSHVSINTGSGTKTRYFVLHLALQRAHRRRFDSSGKEVNPNFSETQKVRTGYLNSYKVEAKGQTDRIDNREVQKLLQKSDLEEVYRKAPSLVSVGCLCLWLPECQTEIMDISENDCLRITTKGNSPFIENLVKMETESPVVSNFAGEQVGANWTDKIMSIKSDVKDTSSVGDDNDDEWDD